MVELEILVTGQRLGAIRTGFENGKNFRADNQIGGTVGFPRAWPSRLDGRGWPDADEKGPNNTQTREWQRQLEGRVSDTHP